MRTIERHNTDERIAPDPTSLRDTMLAVAALLHLEGANVRGEALYDAFAEAAKLQLVSAVKAAGIVKRRN
jgi:hypothetical protein